MVETAKSKYNPGGKKGLRAKLKSGSVSSPSNSSNSSPESAIFSPSKQNPDNLGLKVKRDFICLYCNDMRHPFNSLEAVKKHMVAKNHCKVHYGDGDKEEEAELEEFYDYSSSYVDEAGKQLVVFGDMANNVELRSGGSELIITRRSDDGISSKTLGSRECLRYYRQKLHPSPANVVAITAA